MAENPKKDSKTPSMLEISEMVDKIQRQLNPLSFGGKAIDSIMPRMANYEQLHSAASIANKAFQQSSLMPAYFENQSAVEILAQSRAEETMAFNFEESNSLLKMASQHGLPNSAVNIADIANKIAQKLSLASSNVVDQSVIARQAQLSIPEAIAFKDTLLGMKEGQSAYSSIMSARESLIQSKGGTSVYENMMSSVNLIRDSLEPYRSAFDAVRTSFEASESFELARELQSQVALSNSISSEYSSVFEKLVVLSNLESFKEISRLENLPNDAEFDQDQLSDTTLGDPRVILAEVERLDAKINKEVSRVNDFNDLSEETKKNSKLFLKYYYWLVMNLVVSLCLFEDSLGKDLDLSRKSFTIVNNIGEGVIDIGHYWNGNKVALLNGFILINLNKIIEFISS